MSELMNIDRLPATVRKNVSVYGRRLLEVLEGAVRALFVYGSAAGPDFVAGVSDVNLGVVCDRWDFQLLTKSLRVVDWGIRRRIAAPLFLTPEYIRSSLDVFPIEFSEMQMRHVLLYGEDILADLEISGEHIRLFCEQQIKGRLVRIRQAYLEVGLKTKGMESLLKESLRSLFPVFRHLVRLRGEDPADRKDRLLEQLARLFDLDAEVFTAIHKDAADDERIAGESVRVYLARYVDQVTALARKVDAL